MGCTPSEKRRYRSLLHSCTESLSRASAVHEPTRKYSVFYVFPPLVTGLPGCVSKSGFLARPESRTAMDGWNRTEQPHTVEVMKLPFSRCVPVSYLLLIILLVEIIYLKYHWLKHCYLIMFVTKEVARHNNVPLSSPSLMRSRELSLGHLKGYGAVCY